MSGGRGGGGVEEEKAGGERERDDVNLIIETLMLYRLESPLN